MKKCTEARVTRVNRKSICAKLGIKPGDLLLSIGGYPYVDEMDLMYYEQECRFPITVRRGEEVLTFNVDKGEQDELGIEVQEKDLDIILCKNNCVFCFVAQCPKGMRETLYVKDDDYRMSFACGNYVTFSNASREDIDRIIRLHLSPLYISVHCYDKEIKKQLCRNPNSAGLFDIMRELATAGIEMHTQIVMVEGMNDGAVLMETLHELGRLYPAVRTVAVVPVGLTKCRNGLYPLSVVSEECAADTVDMVETFCDNMKATNGEPFVWCSDEMYILAQRELPSYDSYGEFSQIENGVGLVANFFMEAELQIKDGIIPKGEFTVVTGVSFGALLQNFCNRLEREYDVKIHIAAIENNFFGKTVTVAGLVTGGDIISSLKGKVKCENLIVPKNMLREFQNVFLDDVSVETLEEALGVTVHVSDGGDGFIKILGGEK